MKNTAESLLAKIEARDALVGIIGLGYVGLPLALTFVEKGFSVLGFDVDPEKVEKINRGECYIKHLDPARLARAIAKPATQEEGEGGLDTAPASEAPTAAMPIPGREGELKTQNSKLRTDGPLGREESPPASEASSDSASRSGGVGELKTKNSKLKTNLVATSDFSRLREPDAILICVPTPLTPQREPDMTYIRRAAFQIHETLRPGQLIVLESTTWPGTTDELILPILEGRAHRRSTDPPAWPPEGDTLPGWTGDTPSEGIKNGEGGPNAAPASESQSNDEAQSSSTRHPEEARSADEGSGRGQSPPASDAPSDSETHPGGGGGTKN